MPRWATPECATESVPNRWRQPSGDGRQAPRRVANTSGMADGPLIGMHVAPAWSASTSGVVQVALGRHDHQLVERRAAATHVARHRGPTVRQQHGRAGGPPATAASCAAGRLQGQGHVGGAEAPQRQQVLHDLLGRPEGALALGHHHVAAEGQHAVVVGRPPRHGRRRHRRRGQRARLPIEPLRSTTRHRAVPGRDQPRTRSVVGIGRASPWRGPWPGRRSRRRRRGRPAVVERPAPPACPRPGAGATPGGRGRPRSGRPARRARSRSFGSVAPVRSASSAERLVGRLAEHVVEGRLVELADLGRHLVEALVARQLAPRGRALGPPPGRPPRPPALLARTSAEAAPLGASAFSLATPGGRAEDLVARARG